VSETECDCTHGVTHVEINIGVANTLSAWHAGINTMPAGSQSGLLPGGHQGIDRDEHGERHQRIHADFLCVSHLERGAGHECSREQRHTGLRQTAAQDQHAVWQFLAGFPLLLAAGVTLRWGPTTNDASRCGVTERAGRRGRRHTATHRRYRQWPWLTSPTVATATPR
jgi:hypothetical protein